MAKELEVISLQDVIPYSITGDKNVQAILKSVDPQLQEVSQSVREAFILSRFDELPENVIDLLAWQWHVDFYEPELPIATKRELVRESISWHRKKGTKAAIISALEKLDFVPTIKEWYEPELQTEPHTFSVRGYYKDDQIDVDFLGEETHEILTRIIENTKPARSRLIKLTIAPIPIDLTDHICRWDVCSWSIWTHCRLTGTSSRLLNLSMIRSWCLTISSADYSTSAIISSGIFHHGTICLTDFYISERPLRLEYLPPLNGAKAIRLCCLQTSGTIRNGISSVHTATLSALSSIIQFL
ncbi:MAG: phage tail protein I [Synergistaceae bacterium]|nr:phage tail protein I [Synergistaceae bacterium]